MTDGIESGTDEVDDAQRTSSQRVQAAILENYVPAQYAFVQFLSEHLLDCRKSVGGDLDDVMLLAVLGQRLLAARINPGQGLADSRDRDWMSALRIADVTGIPRESVRRKLNRLAERGWVTHDPAQGWALAGSHGMVAAKTDLSELDRRGIERLGKLVASLLPLLAKNRSAPTAPDDNP